MAALWAREKANVTGGWLRAMLVAALPGACLACAADPGDAPKGDGGPLGHDAAYSSSGSSSGSGPADVSLPDYAVATYDTGPAQEEPIATLDGSGEADAVISDATSEPEVGTGPGCAAGAMVVTMTLPSGQFTANSGNFGSTGPVCVELHGSVHMGWGVSNWGGRMLTVTSAAGTTPTLDETSTLAPMAPQAGTDGFVYWNFTAGSVDYTSVYIF